MTLVLHRNSNTRLTAFLWKTLLVFMFVYKNTPIDGMTFITSERVAVLLLFFTAVLKKNGKVGDWRGLYCNRLWKCEVTFQVFLLVYTLVLMMTFGVGDGSTLTEEIINFLIVTPIAVYSLRIVIESVDELMKILLIITLFQSIVVLAGFFSPSIGSFIDHLPMNQTHIYWTYDYYRSMGYPGGIACVAAKGSLQMALGCIASYYFISKESGSVKYWLYYFVIAIAMTAVARTGLIISLIVFFFVIKDNLRNRKFGYKVALFTGVALIGLLLTFFVVDSSLLVGNLGKSFYRVYDLFERGFYNSFLKYYFHGSKTVIPPVSWKTIIGTNVLSGTSGNGVTVIVDGGYLRMYVALGIPLAIFFYVFQCVLMFKCRTSIKKKISRAICLLFTILLFLGEFKEFYFYLRYLIVLFFVYCHYAELEDSPDGYVF